MLCPKNFGGLDMMYMVTQAKALKISWVKRLGTAPYNTGWRQLVNIQFTNLASFIFKCNLAFKDIKQTLAKFRFFLARSATVLV